MVLRVYGDDDLSKPSRVLTALEYALENGAAVVNMSLGWPNAIEKGYSFLNTVLAQAYASGVVVVTAAGNRSQSNPTGDADDVYPANQAAALTVSAVDRSRTFDDSYSASGASVDLCAPGSYVTVAAPGGGTAVRSGTSFAAPHIAAAAACVLLAQPGLSAARVRQTLYRYADDLGDPGRDDEYGHGFPVLTQYFHDRLCPGRTFRDMPEPDFWSHAGLDYCIGAGLMAGTSDVTVSPEALATRAQIVQLLWVAAGSPETAGALPFTDVAPTRGTMPRCAGRTGRGSSPARRPRRLTPMRPSRGRTSRSSSMSSPAARSRRAVRSRPSRMWAALRAMPTPRSPGRSSRGSSAASARTTACASRRAATPAARR